MNDTSCCAGSHRDIPHISLSSSSSDSKAIGSSCTTPLLAELVSIQRLYAPKSHVDRIMVGPTVWTRGLVSEPKMILPVLDGCASSALGRPFGGTAVPAPIVLDRRRYVKRREEVWHITQTYGESSILDPRPSSVQVIGSTNISMSRNDCFSPLAADLDGGRNTGKRR